jgi:rSAM/selenodomain-associated transferase 2
MHSIGISVIIPTLNEEATLAQCLEMIIRTGVEECIVADGGSSDDTNKVALSYDVNFLIAVGGRSAQCNAGAAQARGRILCFLHADTKLPEDWKCQVHQVIDDQGCLGGAFRFGLEGDRLAWRIIEAGVNWRSRWLGLPYGDQAIFVRHDVFSSLGGFKFMPFMEDVDFVFRLKKCGPIGLAHGRAITSPRRWKEEGLFSTTLRNYVALLGYAIGIRPTTLYRWYVRTRGKSGLTDHRPSEDKQAKSAAEFTIKEPKPPGP